ncbi:HAMP domain-containing sensor histidine kinase [Streptomyces chiangmaiensis]|uniref:histidine kinase n=1 Tax=Streptomyces chiangmaiensis TaxID=766497 RepID=A0ABU7FAI9_9ACTN|nr:HAMP domain-containing sensor histidine kinase [Streptomyces chiangmaiensis]MED7821201.1 HAMP domain-containing sensor histidine kinase [Streptomyces chiangmaiensis]
MRRRILHATAVAVVCAVLLFAVPLAVAVLRLYRQDEIGDLERIASRTALAAPTFVPDFNPRALPRVGPGTQLAVYDTAARRVTGSGPDVGDAPVRAALKGSVQSGQTGGRLVVAVPVGSAEKVRGTVRVSRTATWLSQRAVLTWLGMGGLAVVAIGAAALVSLRSSRRLAQPLEALAATARRLESGDLTARAVPYGLPEADEVGTALNRAAERLDRLLQRERAFSADASHQLRTALARTRLELESELATCLPLDPRAAMRAALESLDRMTTTIDDLLALARDVPERAPLDVAALVAETRRRWRGGLEAAGRSLQVVAEEDLPAAVGSQQAARQVLDVLLANAATHGRGAVTVRARDANGVLAIDVEDQGPGLPQDQDVFARRPAGEGHGIGLTLARSLVEAEGGRLFVSRRAPHPCFTWLIAATTGPEAPRSSPDRTPKA